jgi:hypothetical protein
VIAPPFPANRRGAMPATSEAPRFLPGALPLTPAGEPWAVLRMPPRNTLTFLDMVIERPDLEGWTPVQIVPGVDKQGKVTDIRRPMLPGCCFVPVPFWRRSMWAAWHKGMLDVQPFLFNGAMMLTDWAALEGLRNAEEAEREPAPEPEIPVYLLKIGMNVQVTGHVFDGITGLISRLDAIYAHLDVPESASKLVVHRHLLQPI